MKTEIIITEKLTAFDFEVRDTVENLIEKEREFTVEDVGEKMFIFNGNEKSLAMIEKSIDKMRTAIKGVRNVWHNGVDYNETYVLPLRKTEIMRDNGKLYSGYSTF